MTDLLKYISESFSNYLIFLFTILLLYILVVAVISVFFNKLILAIVTAAEVIKSKTGKFPAED
jgi:hypothetical protein